MFSNRFSAVQVLSGAAEGDYLFSFKAIDKDNNESHTESIIAAFGVNESPNIINVSAPDTLYSGTNGQIIQVAVWDNDGIDDIDNVYFESQKTGSGNIIPESGLFNDGDFVNHGDLFADDSVFSIKFDSTFGAGKYGNYNLIFHVKDSFGEENNTIPIHQIFIENEVGEIVSTSVPDTTTRPADLTLYVTVKDPQGLADVDSVYFLLEKPNGTFGGNGAKFDLQDNGDSFYGDLIAGDGIYSKTISISESNDAGMYIFHFYIRDEVGHLTTVTRDSITVY